MGALELNPQNLLDYSLWLFPRLGHFLARHALLLHLGESLAERLHFEEVVARLVCTWLFGDRLELTRIALHFFSLLELTFGRFPSHLFPTKRVEPMRGLAVAFANRVYFCQF